MPYDQFAPCDVPGCKDRRAKRRRWCPGHAAWIDAAKDRNQCRGSARHGAEIGPCFLTRGHEGPCLPQLEVMRRAMGGRTYLRPEPGD